MKANLIYIVVAILAFTAYSYGLYNAGITSCDTKWRNEMNTLIDKNNRLTDEINNKSKESADAIELNIKNLDFNLKDVGLDLEADGVTIVIDNPIDKQGNNKCSSGSVMLGQEFQEAWNSLNGATAL